MSNESETQDWSKPAAMAIRKGGYLRGQDRARALWAYLSQHLPATASHPRKNYSGARGRLLQYAKSIEETIAAEPDALAVLQLHYLRWVLFPSKGTPTPCTKAFSTPTSTNTQRRRYAIGITGLRTVFESLEDFPMDWQTNPARSSSSSAIINAELPRIPRNIRMRARLRSRSPQTEGRVLDHARTTQ